MAVMRSAPDIILCDVSMPTMTGFEVLERLNEIAPRLGRIPFVFLTALADRENELKGRRLGADDYVSKTDRLRPTCIHYQRPHCRGRANEIITKVCETYTIGRSKS